MLSKLRTVKSLLLLTAANSFLWTLISFILPASIEESIGWSLVYSIPYNLLRVVILAYAGWLVVHVEKRGLWRAALIGGLVLFIDHPVVGGGTFLLQGETDAFIGVLISYVMFVWAAMLVAFLGGLAAKFRVSGQRA